MVKTFLSSIWNFVLKPWK